jgi:hypothetical protein
MATRYHVNINSGDDANDGLKWSSAFENLQTALDTAKTGDEIWIAAGTYHPTKKIADVYGKGNLEPTNERHRSFMIPKNVKVYGGFPAGATDATSMSSRNWKEHQTILSGDFDDNDGDNFENMGENAYHVVILFDATPSTVLDGLYITGGCADDDATTYTDEDYIYYVTGVDGGGIYAHSPASVSSPTISDVSFYGNYAKAAGGAMLNYADTDDASPEMTNVSFIQNKAANRHGGGLFNSGVRIQATLTNVNVVGNASNYSGGGLYFLTLGEDICSPTITNTVVNGNYAKNGNGGGIYIATYGGDAEPYIINSTICGNRMETTGGKDGGGLAILAEGVSKAHILNTVIWGNKGVNHDNFYTEGTWGIQNTISGSLIEGDDLGDTNLPGDTDPKFLDAVDATFAPTLEGDYQLTLESPLINKGINDYISASIDLLDHPRIFDGTVDIGAYESQGKTPVNNEAIFSEKAIWSYNSHLYVRIGQPATLYVYSLDGTLVKHINNLGQGSYEYSLPQGIYIVTLSDGTTEKVVIR